MTAPLRIVQSPGDRDALAGTARDLTTLIAEHQARGQVLADERRRVLREMYLGGMDAGDISRATGISLNDVRRLLRGKR